MRVTAALLVLALCSPSPAHAQASDEGPIVDTIAGILEMMQMIRDSNISHLYIPSNDNLSQGATNTLLYFRPQSECNQSNNHANQVPGAAIGPCVPDAQYPPFGYAIGKLSNLTPLECGMLIRIATGAITNTVVPGTENRIPISIPAFQTVNPASGIPFTGPGGQALGGICSPSNTLTAGWVGPFLGVEQLKAPGNFSNEMCAWLINFCLKGTGILNQGSCTCGPYAAPG